MAPSATADDQERVPTCADSLLHDPRRRARSAEPPPAPCWRRLCFSRNPMRTLHVLPVIFLGVIFAAACTSNIADDGCGGPMGGGAPDGGAGGHPTDGGCISPTEGEACSSGEVACQPPDPCCTGDEWFCMAGTWQKAGLGCAC